MKTNGEDMAFPIVEPHTQCSVSYGMTKREYFAALALQGICGSLSGKGGERIIERAELREKLTNDASSLEVIIAGKAVSLADALIAALNKGGGANG